MKNKISKKIIIISLLLLLAGIAGFYTLKEMNTNRSIETSTGQKDKETAYSPPTAEEIKAGDEQKEELPTNNAPPAASQSANVVIVDAGQYDTDVEVRAFVSSHFLDGTCSMKFTLNDKLVEKSVKAVPNASTTPCMNLVFPASDLSVKGSWQLQVDYSSTDGTVKGSSKTRLEIK